MLLSNLQELPSSLPHNYQLPAGLTRSQHLNIKVVCDSPAQLKRLQRQQRHLADWLAEAHNFNRQFPAMAELTCRDVVLVVDQLLGFACQWASRTLKPSALGLHNFMCAPMVLEVRANCNMAGAEASSVWSASLLPYTGTLITTQQAVPEPAFPCAVCGSQEGTWGETPHHQEVHGCLGEGAALPAGSEGCRQDQNRGGA